MSSLIGPLLPMHRLHPPLCCAFPPQPCLPGLVFCVPCCTQATLSDDAVSRSHIKNLCLGLLGPHGLHFPWQFQFSPTSCSSSVCQSTDSGIKPHHSLKEILAYKWQWSVIECPMGDMRDSNEASGSLGMKATPHV